MRNLIKNFLNLVWIFFFLFSFANSFGIDTDLYVLSGVNVPPNVLIILDNSASMDEVSSGQNYDWWPWRKQTEIWFS